MYGKRIVLVIVCLYMIIGVIPAVAAADDESILINLQFDSQVTNATPSGVVIPDGEGTVVVEQPDPAVQNKVMTVIKPVSAATVNLNLTSAANNVVYQFDFMMQDTLSQKRFILRDNAGQFSEMLRVEPDGTAILPDNRKPLTITVGRWYNFAFAYHYGTGRYEFYVNGQQVANRIAIQNASFTKGTTLRFQSSSGQSSSRFSFDNIRFYTGKWLLDNSAFGKEVYNSAAVETELMLDTVDPDEALWINDNFDNSKTGGVPENWAVDTKTAGNVIEIADFPSEKNKSVHLSKQADGDPMANYTIEGFAANSAVLELAFYSKDRQSDKTLLFRSEAGAFETPLRIDSGGYIQVSGQNIMQYKSRKWYKIGLILDMSAKTTDVYVDGRLAAEKVPFANSSFTVPATIRLQMPANSGYGAVYFDDIRFYAGNDFKTNEELVTATEAALAANIPRLITTEETVIPTMAGMTVVLSGDNTAWSNGQKQELDVPAVKENEVLYMPVRFAVESLGGQVAWDEADQRMDITAEGLEIQCWIGRNQAQVNGKTVQLSYAPLFRNDRGVIAVADLAEKLMNVPFQENMRYGIAFIGGRSGFLNDKQIKDIYDFLLYTRPTAEQILKDFEPMKGQHPRIMATADTFDQIREGVATDPTLKQWGDNVIAEADSMITQTHTEYVKPDGLRILESARQILERSITLGMAWQLTGDTKYTDYLWHEYEQAANFPDWNAQNHFLDPSELTNGMAIGYDWCYDYWSDHQKEVIEDAIMEMGLRQAEKCYLGRFGSSGRWVTWNWNWNIVCNGGMSVGALALMDKEPEFCSWLLENAFRSVENMLGEFAPDGAWKEGPGYWDYTVSYLVYFMSALDTALGTDYGYFDSNGIRYTAHFLAYTQSYQGSFGFNDTGSGVVNAPNMFYFASKLKDGELARLRLSDMENYGFDGSARDLLYFDADVIADSADLWPDRKFGYVEMATFRSSFLDHGALFTGILGGDNAVEHGNLDCGTFILDAMGERWAIEMGSDDYNLLGYFTYTDTGRWLYYRCNAQGQNVIALNPTTELGQSETAFATIEQFETKARGGYAVVNTESAYPDKVSSAKRGLKLDHDRTQVVVQDELKLTQTVDLWWFMHTNANIEISEDGKSALLTLNGRKMYAVLDSNATAARFQDIAAQPLPGSALPASQANNGSTRKLAINLPKAKGFVNISVRFIPIYAQEMLEELRKEGIDKMVSIDKWEIEDGEISRAMVESITVDGQPLEGFDPQTSAYSVKREFGVKTPQVAVTADDRFDVEITQAESENGVATIKITEKEHPENRNYYSISFAVLPLIGKAEGYTQLTVQSVMASDEPQPENPKENVLDGDADTRWSANGTQWIQLDMGSVQEFSAITMAFYLGTRRVTYFDIEVSEDGKSWSRVYSGESGGTTDGFETYFVGDQRARYIRVTGYGNSSNSWTSFNEIQIYGR